MGMWNGDSIAELILGGSPAIRGVRAQIEKLAQGPVRTLLIVGESGVGKELVPRAFLACAPQRWRHLEVFNCPAVPMDHLESELFGTARGAFPGAESRPGALERAAGGILFLDEIAALAPHHQPKVLRMLDSGEGRRLGSAKGYRADTAMLAATREDLASHVERGQFREDLYYRLIQDGVLRIPPLRQRCEDVPALVALFQAELGCKARFDRDALALLQAQPWPGNVRQLRAVVRSASRMADGEWVGRELVADALRGIGRPLERPASDDSAATEEVFRLLPVREKRRLLCEALRRARGNQTQAGVLLGFHRSKHERPIEDLNARKLAHRKFRYWWRRTGLDFSPEGTSGPTHLH